MAGGHSLDSHLSSDALIANINRRISPSESSLSFSRFKPSSPAHYLFNFMEPGRYPASFMEAAVYKHFLFKGNTGPHGPGAEDRVGKLILETGALSPTVLGGLPGGTYERLTLAFNFSSRLSLFDGVYGRVTLPRGSSLSLERMDREGNVTYQRRDNIWCLFPIDSLDILPDFIFTDRANISSTPLRSSPALAYAAGARIQHDPLSS
jgi:hypothetical protein